MRSIPACAGETRAALPSSDVRQVHPRVCGGNMVPGTLAYPPWTVGERPAVKLSRE